MKNWRLDVFIGSVIFLGGLSLLEKSAIIGILFMIIGIVEIVRALN